MPNNTDYRQYLEEKFSKFELLIEDRFTNLDIKLNSIHEQTSKTNGRVTNLELKTFNLEKADIQHTITCPQAPRLKTIEDKLNRSAAINMWLLRALGIAASLVGIFYAAVKIYESLHS
jgi:hypothetical protein